MKRKRHTPEEIIKKLRAAEEALAGGKTVEEACRLISVSLATYQRWKSQYSGVKKDVLKRLKELEWLPVLDEFTRECLSLEVERSMTSGDVLETLELLVAQRGAPEFIRSDNGPEFVANAVKDWIAEKGFKTLFIGTGWAGNVLPTALKMKKLLDRTMLLNVITLCAAADEAEPP